MKNLTKSGKLFLCGAVAAALVFLASVVMFAISIVKADEESDLGFDLTGYDVVKMTLDDENNRIAGTQEGDVFAFSESGDLLWDVGKLRDCAVYDIAIKDNLVYAVFADGSILSFSEEDASAFSSAGEEGQAFGAKCTEYRLDYSISGNVKNTQLLVGNGEFYLRARCNDGANRNYLFRFETGEEFPEEIRKSAGNFSIGGMVYFGGRFVYSYRGDLISGGEKLLALDEDILALSASETEISMITAGGKLVIFSAERGEIVYEESLSESLDSSYVFSTGENFLAKTQSGNAVKIDTSERSLESFTVGRDSVNFILWNDECFMLRDTTDVENPFVLFYTEEQARLNALFSVLRWVFLALAIVMLALAIILFLCIREERRLKIKKGTVSFFKSIWRDRAIYLSLLIPFGLLITFYYVPTVLGFSISFLDYVPGVKSNFMGFKYFAEVLRSADFWNSVGTMMLFLLADLAKALIPPFIIAELLITVRFKRFSLWVRILLFIPGILPGVAATLVWMQGVFDSSTNSLVNGFIKVFAPSFTGLNWIYNPSYMVRVLTIVCFGFPWVGSYLIFFGALGGINTSIFEAAKLDGCPWITRVFKLDIPLILSQFKYVLITTFIASVQNYGTLYILYGTGARDTLMTPALTMYGEIAKGNYNIASVMGMFLFVFLAVVTVSNFRSQKEQID